MNCIENMFACMIYFNALIQMRAEKEEEGRVVYLDSYSASDGNVNKNEL